MPLPISTMAKIRNRTLITTALFWPSQAFQLSRIGWAFSAIASMTARGAATPSTATSTYTAPAPTSCPVDRLAEAMATAAATPTMMFFGLSAPMPTPTIRDLPGANPAIPFIHFGIDASWPGFGLPRNWRSAATSKSAPSTNWRIEAPFDGPEPADRLIVPQPTDGVVPARLLQDVDPREITSPTMPSD